MSRSVELQPHASTFFPGIYGVWLGLGLAVFYGVWNFSGFRRCL